MTVANHLIILLRFRYACPSSLVHLNVWQCTHSKMPRITWVQDASLVSLYQLVIIHNMWLSCSLMIILIPRIRSIFKMLNKFLLVTKSEIPMRVLMMQDEETRDRNVLTDSRTLHKYNCDVHLFDFFQFLLLIVFIHFILE